MQVTERSETFRSKPFQGKVAFVSGGSRGIGLAIAEKLAQLGAHIVFSYLRSRADAEKAEARISAFQTEVVPVRANMGNAKHVREIFSAIREKFGFLDFFIHNAATGDLKPVLELSPEEWDRAQEINVKSLLRCAQAAVPLMAGRGGKIVSISSRGSERCLPNYAAVGAAKSAIECLSRYLALELAPRKINVNVVSAGITETQSLKQLPHYQEMLLRAQSRTPAGRIGVPQDIADVVCFLCSEESRWIVGQTIVADGGYSLLT